MLDAKGHVRLADMGMCRTQLSPDNLASTFCGTPDYIAPEVRLTFDPCSTPSLPFLLSLSLFLYLPC